QVCKNGPHRLVIECGAQSGKSTLVDVEEPTAVYDEDVGALLGPQQMNCWRTRAHRRRPVGQDIQDWRDHVAAPYGSCLPWTTNLRTSSHLAKRSSYFRVSFSSRLSGM